MLCKSCPRIGSDAAGLTLKCGAFLPWSVTPMAGRGASCRVTDVVIAFMGNLSINPALSNIPLVPIGGPRSGVIPGITADIIWSDVSQHWTAGYNLQQLNPDGSLDFQYGGGVAINTVFSGASALGGGWTYQFSVSGGVFQLKYFHFTLAPNGEAPATNLYHEIDSGYALAGGVYLSGEAGNDNEWRIAS